MNPVNQQASMHFVFSGFTEKTGFRVFAFQGVAEDRSETEFTVQADLALTRTYGIRVQELPLLCRVLLDRCDRTEPARTLTFTEEMMRMHASKRVIKPRGAVKKPKHAGVATPPAGIEKEIRMEPLEKDGTELDEEVWQAWVRKGKLLDQAAARTMKVCAAAALAVAAIGSSLYYLALR